jgi:hypothetical protein
MKVNRQSRIFAKQVQVDLLALSDADLFQAVHPWVNEEPARPCRAVPEETRSALGYTLRVGEPQAPSLNSLSVSEVEAGRQWLAPAPEQLRALLMEMDVKRFIQYVLPLAFQALHMTHPEWGEGPTFNAHLANHLRWIGKMRSDRTSGPGTPHRRLSL